MKGKYTGYNELAAQKRVFAALSAGLPMMCAPLDDGRIAVADGFVGYVFERGALLFNMDKLKANQAIDSFFIAHPGDRPVAATRSARVVDSKRGVARAYSGAGGSPLVWVQEKLTSGVFDPAIAQFECADGKTRVLVRDNSGAIVGVVLPFTFSEEAGNDNDNR